MNFRIFEKYDCDRDGALNPQELINLFSTCPLMPWGQDIYNTVTTQPNTGWLGLPGFLGENEKYAASIITDNRNVSIWF